MVRSFKIFECSDCGKEHETEMKAVKCCEAKADIRWRCGECHTLYESEEDAEECCENLLEYDEDEEQQPFNNDDTITV